MKIRKKGKEINNKQHKKHIGLHTPCNRTQKYIRQITAAETAGICCHTLTISAVASKENLTASRTPVMTMAVTTAHVTPMITCFRVKRDFLPSPLGSAWNDQSIQQSQSITINMGIGMKVLST